MTVYNVYTSTGWAELSNLSIYNGSWQSLRYARRWDGASWIIFWDSFKLTSSVLFPDGNLTSPEASPPGNSTPDDSEILTVSGLSVSETLTLQAEATGSFLGTIDVFKNSFVTPIYTLDQFDNTTSFTVSNTDYFFFRFTNGPQTGFNELYGSLTVTRTDTSEVLRIWTLQGYTGS